MQRTMATKTNQQDPFWVDPGVPTLPEAEQLIASLMPASWPDWPISACPGIISDSGISTKINKENAIDDKQLRNTGLSNNYTAYGAGKRQLHTETPGRASVFPDNNMLRPLACGGANGTDSLGEDIETDADAA
ncbi:hypothetical protein ACLKA6_018891 [Drosophila palustris]